MFKTLPKTYDAVINEIKNDISNLHLYIERNKNKVDYNFIEETYNEISNLESILTRFGETP